jgi:hypothetical protein
MKLKEAIKRLSFTIAKQNKPNQTDAEALNKILDILELEQQKTIQENLLFAKIYAFTLAELTNYYCDVDFANKEINRILSEPMQLRVNILQLKLKNMEYQNYFKQKKILDPFLKSKTVEELEQIHNIHKHRLPELDPIEFIKCGNNWDYQSVKYQLESSINLSIQNFKNNV